MEVYERIKARRKELGLSADDVAAALGVGWTEDSSLQCGHDDSFFLSPLERQIIMRFRLLSDGERNMFLRSLGLDDTY